MPLRQFAAPQAAHRTKRPGSATRYDPKRDLQQWLRFFGGPKLHQERGASGESEGADIVMQSSEMPPGLAWEFGRSNRFSWFEIVLRSRKKTWLALTACRRATRATDAPASNVSSTMRRFSSTDLRRLFSCLALSIAGCSDVSTYPSWTLIDVPTTGSILNLLSLRPDGLDQSLTDGPSGRIYQSGLAARSMRLGHAR